MLSWIFILVSASILLKKLLFPRLKSAREKLVITLSIGLLFSSLNIGSYLSSKDPNLFEILGVGRMIEVKALLRLISQNAEISSLYEEVKNDQYETRCLNASSSDFIGESFSYYGSSLIVINLVSFSNTGSSRSMLLLVLLNLLIEYCLISKYITLQIFKYTTCELIQILRHAMPGLAFIAAILAFIRVEAAKKAKKDLNDKFCQESENYKKLNDLVSQMDGFQQLDCTDVLKKVIDEQAKKAAPPSNRKKYFKWFFIGYMFYSFYFKSR